MAPHVWDSPFCDTLSLPFPLLLSPFCLLSAAEGKPKAPTTHRASPAAVKQRCQKPKCLFSSSAISCGCSLGWHQGPGLMSAREFLLKCRRKISLQWFLQPECFLWGICYPVGCTKRGSFLGGAGVCVGLFSGQGPNDLGWAFSSLYGKTAIAHLGFYGKGGMWIKN